MELKLMCILCAVMFALPLAVTADRVGPPDEECQEHGFDFGVVRWEPLDAPPGWEPEEGNPMGTSVNGTVSAATWDVGTSNATGVVVKAGQDYAVYHGSGGTIFKDEHEFSHITFCGEENEIPEFTAIGVLIAAALSGLFIFLLKRK